MHAFDVLRGFALDFLPFEIVEVEFLGELFRPHLLVADEEEFDAFDRIGDSS